MDARAAARYQSPPEGPPADPDTVPGHIPKSVNRPFAANFARNNLLKTKEKLAEEFAQTFAHRPISEVVCSCGSGVTACLNIAAAEYAGVGVPKLYVGSWSQWIKHYPNLNHDNVKP